MRLYGVVLGIFIVGALCGFFLFISTVNGDVSSIEKKCVIIVSGSEDYSQSELNKAYSFRECMLDEMDPIDIKYLTDPEDPYSDGPANQSNIENAFNWLQNESHFNTEVIVYISDHIIALNNNNTFIFDDCNITTSTINGWLDCVDNSEMTIILNGERSGLGGPDLSGPGKVVICSMRSFQECDPDLFDITRGLEDPSGDTNQDGTISYIEAYWKEVENLQGADQEPLQF